MKTWWVSSDGIALLLCAIPQCENQAGTIWSGFALCSECYAVAIGHPVSCATLIECIKTARERAG